MSNDKDLARMPEFPESYWRESVEIPSFESLKENIHVDVGIVGGGITGITTAYLLVKQGLKVALLDSGKLLNGTTGHTTAKITAQHGLIYDELIQHLGEEKASMYYQTNSQAIEFIKDTIDEHNIDCDFTRQDAFVYTSSDKYVKKMDKEMKAYEKLGIKGELSDSVPFGFAVKSVISMKDQAQFHPLQYLMALVNYITENGAQIYENTTAVDVENSDHPNIITREGKRVICDRVVAASHFPFYGGQGYYFSRMYPERSYLIAVKGEKEYPGGMYISAEEPTRSLRSASFNGEQLWLIAGEKHKTGQGESTEKHYQALQEFAEQHIGIKQFVSRWSAQDLTTLDKVPYIGPVTQDQSEVLIATGYRKWGMTNGTAAAQMIAALIKDGKHPYQELFLPSRFHADPDLKKFAQINADVSKQMVKGKLEFTSLTIDDIKEDEGNIVRVNGNRTGVYRDKDGEVHLVDTTCTHLGCEVNWNQGDRTWDCPCHGSRFKIDGEVIEGPAQTPLKKFAYKHGKDDE
ncbi:FAD-dependent oxidoreductase [Radiobacillus sp. PE A8.2]|uniref:FAD-dependent oxidoreductase n=1 Tax=Radiobacillus sp. PE A8.2 TaxID=3380349 RepID=UPI00388E66C0